MKQRYIQILILSLLLIFSEKASAQLPKEFTNVDNDVIKRTCGSTFEYALDKPFSLHRSFNQKEYEDRKANLELNAQRTGPGFNDPAIYEERLQLLEEFKEPFFQDEFHEMVNCYINKSLKDTIDETNEKVQEQHEAYEKAGHYPVEIETTTECEIEISPPSFESTCSEELPEFSPCRVAETLAAEHCAYSMWLWAKQHHSESLIFPENEYYNLEDVNTLRDIRLNELGAERQKTEKAIFRTVQAYEQNAKNFGNYAYSESAREHLLYFNEKLTLFRQAFESFPEKFINAMAKFCKQ